MEYNLFDFVRPELLVLIPVLVIIGKIIKDSEIANKWIPLMLGGIGIVLGVAYMLIFPDELTPAQAILAESEYVDARDAVGRILAETVVSMPPCVPVYMCGEVLGEDAFSYIKGTVRVIKETLF